MPFNQDNGKMDINKLSNRIIGAAIVRVVNEFKE